MAIPQQVARGHLVLTPRQPLVAGGEAEDFEASVKRLLGQGYRLLIADLNAVTAIDSAGIRALVRAHTSAGRVGGSFRIARPTTHTLELLKIARLDNVLSVYDSIHEAKHQAFKWREIATIGVGISACLLIAGIGLEWRIPQAGPAGGAPMAPDSATGALWATLGCPFGARAALSPASSPCS
jgi:anti-anti-sigma factor